MVEHETFNAQTSNPLQADNVKTAIAEMLAGAAEQNAKAEMWLAIADFFKAITPICNGIAKELVANLKK